MTSNNRGASVRSNSWISNGFKSRPRSCPFASVAQESGVLVTEGRKFSIGKAAGRNTSEPIYSLVNLFGDADPLDTRGRPLSQTLTTESVCVIFRGSRDGMLRKILNPVLETRYGDVSGTSTVAYKETKSRWAVSGVGGVHSTVW